ncbi:tetratricopeptide repeat protein [bacterium]|nr:tetratricopeptide repeat protein [bacterium]
MDFSSKSRLPILILAIVLLGIGSASAGTETLALIKVGMKAPPLLVEGTDGEVDLCDQATTSPLLLLFLKPEDRYAAQTVQAIEDLFTRFPMVREGYRRAVIYSRFTRENKSEIPETMGPDWPVYRDIDDKAYHDYNIIATPSIVIVDETQHIAAVQPGYDHSMPEWLLTSLAGVLDVQLPEAVTKKPERPNMALQMGRRMAERGLWQRAAKYYAKAAEEQALSTEAQIELAGIHLELGEKAEALAIIDALPEEAKGSDEVAALRQRATKQEPRQEELGAPPKVNR